MWCANPLISLTDQDDVVSFMKYLQEGQSLSDTLISVSKEAPPNSNLLNPIVAMAETK